MYCTYVMINFDDNDNDNNDNDNDNDDVDLLLVVACSKECDDDVCCFQW